MIRLLIAWLMVLMASNANAVTNETLYQNCKEYSERGFRGETLGDLACTTYFIGVGETSRMNCWLETLTGIPFNSENNNAAIQHYVIEMKNKPEEWKMNAALYVFKSLRLINGSECPPK